MKRVLSLATGLWLALTATTASAAGYSVAWGERCWSDVPTSNLTWTCTSNTFTGIRMTVSFRPTVDLPDFVGVRVWMRGITETATVPDWWKLGNPESGDCRAGLVTLHTDGSVAAGGSGSCADPWQGAGTGLLGAYTWSENRMWMSAECSLADPVPLVAEHEYFALQFRISAARTVGTCSGCLVPAVWCVEAVEVGCADPARSDVLDYWYANGNDGLTWESSTLPCHVDGPVEGATWGRIKSLYR